MKWLPGFALLACACGQGSAPAPAPTVTGPTVADAREVVSAVLAFLADDDADRGGQACVVPALSEAMQSQRAVADITKQIERVAAAGGTSADHRWLGPQPGSTTDDQPPVLALDVQRRLDRLVDQALLTPQPVRLAAIDRAQVPAPLRLQAPGAHCDTIVLSSPGFVGDAAIVEEAYGCGSLCGSGTLYALERRNRRWTLVARAATWVS